HRRIVVNRCSEERNHPLVDQFLAVIALPIRDSSTSYGRTETVSLGDGPHRHEPAITPSRNANTFGIDRIFGNRGVDTGRNIAQVSSTEVFHICFSKIFTLTLTSARIRQE